MRFALSPLRSLIRLLRWIRRRVHQPAARQDEAEHSGIQAGLSLWRDPEFITAVAKAGDTLIKLLWFLLALAYAAGCFDPPLVLDSPVVRALIQVGKP